MSKSNSKPRNNTQNIAKANRIKAVKASEERYKRFIDGYQVWPNYNKNGCEYFNSLMLEMNVNIQHAENGGEYHIKELGYFVDGYDRENNIVYEWDECHHYIGGKLREKDLIRQKEIENFLHCKFIRIKE